MIKRKFYGREKYRCKVRVRKADKYGIYKDTVSTSKYLTTFVVGEYIQVDLNSKIYNKIYNEMNKDELMAYFNTEEIGELLTELVDRSKIRGKIVVAISETERVFREKVFNKIYTLLQNEKAIDKILIEEEINYNSLLDFDISQFNYLNTALKSYIYN
jgi:hypothetical protein